MSDEKNPNQPAEQNAQLEATGIPVTVHAQYIRDLSFENPGAPDALRGGQDIPEMNVNIGMDTRALDSENISNLYEVSLTISATAARAERPVFLCEVVYGVTVSIGEAVPADQHHALLLIEIPRMAFPFARQILAELTSQGGYPPLLLNPVDFHALYLERFKDDIEKAQAETVN